MGDSLAQDRLGRSPHLFWSSDAFFLRFVRFLFCQLAFHHIFSEATSDKSSKLCALKSLSGVASDKSSKLSAHQMPIRMLFGG